MFSNKINHLITTEESRSDEIIAGMCNKYYHNLKDNSAVSKLSFEERLSTAREVIERCKEIDLYFYRRTNEDFLLPGAESSSGHFSPVNLASNDYLGFTQHSAIINA